MQIRFSPQRRSDSLQASKSDDVLTINGAVFDFSGLPDGGTIDAGDIPCEWIAGPVHRIGGTLHLTLLLPHGPSPSPAVAFPEPLIDPADGLLAIPFDPEVTEPEIIDEEPADVDG